LIRSSVAIITARSEETAMRVLLREDVDNLGYAGEVMDVANGYGRNYLIPRGLAVMATPSVLKQARAWRQRAAARLEELRLEHEGLAARVRETRLEFSARAGETGKLYGSITTNDIVEQLNQVLGTDIDRRSVPGGPLRQLGEHQVTIRLSRDYQPQVLVVINPFEETEEAGSSVDGEETEGVEKSDIGEGDVVEEPTSEGEPSVEEEPPAEVES
jgi:large subunit ribosomal protein L9